MWGIKQLGISQGSPSSQLGDIPGPQFPALHDSYDDDDDDDDDDNDNDNGSDSDNDNDKDNDNNNDNNNYNDNKNNNNNNNNNGNYLEVVAFPHSGSLSTISGRIGI